MIKKIVIIAMVGLALSGCSSSPSQQPAPKKIGNDELRVVCLDGVQYWHIPGVSLAPRFYKSSNMGYRGQIPRVYEC